MTDNRRPSLLRPRFTMATMILMMVLSSVLGAGLYYGNRAIDAGFSFEGIVVVLVICAPPILLLTMIVAHKLMSWINRRDDS